MPGPYTVLNARVKQKIATEAEWLAEEDAFGVIFEGEQAFVKDDEGNLVNFKIGDGTKKFSELPYFITYLTDTVNNKILEYINQTVNVVIPGIFRNKSDLYDIVFINQSGGSLTLNIGTTDGGSEIASIDFTTGATHSSLKKYFEAPTTLYFTGLTGKLYTMLIIYYQYDAHPAVPPTSSGTFLYKKGTTGIFTQLYPGHAAEVWDFATGQGKVDSGYDNCVLCGTNGTPSRAGKYSIGWTTGDTIGGIGGNANHQIIQTIPQLPRHNFTFDKNIVLGRSDNARDADVYTAGWDGSTNVLRTNYVGEGQPMNIQPWSIKDLYFVAVS
jgi:hypothetical protein